MSIKDLEYDDVARIVALGLEFHAESPRFSRQIFDADKVAEWVTAFITEPDLKGFVAVEKQGFDMEIVGFMAASIGPTFFGPTLIAVDEVIFVKKSARRSSVATELMDSYRQWAQSVGAEEINFGMNCQIPGAKKFGEFMGYEKVGFQMVYRG